ncbi:hypothetical protein N7456_013561 [Penicillium angulare]|uniref:Uncharacterized protein n=1 Tax=Penicillium angulare TaxID=116970 RepID=A0A9W9JT08_9EURO|nr:hypothetical protein N7456_013561 [Penicillium angulare]
MRIHQEWMRALPALACLFTSSLANDELPDLENANHIFNSIQSTLRHWGSAINYNGMSFFLASVPQGTQFYHGTGLKDPVKGTEWLAFKPEHSLGFAHRSGGRKPKNMDGLNDYPGQQLLNDAQDTITEVEEGGYLHTYAAARDLRLLFIDGMSAGPGAGAESQDRILYNDTIDGKRPVDGPSLGGPPQEQQRAKEACRMAKEDWGDRIDGIARTEGDFEIILCSFERDLELVYITQTKPQEKSPGGPGRGGPRGPGGPGGPGHGKPRGPRPGGDFNSLSTRFDERLGQKVRLDFDHFVSAYTYGLDLFPDNASAPQLGHIPIEKLHPIREDVTALINTRSPSLNAFDWQHIADMIVYRYSDELQTFAAGDFSSLQSLRDRVEQLLEPFIDYREFENSAATIDRCTTEWIPTSAPVHSLGGRAVRTVSKRLCSTMTAVLLNDDLDLETAVTSFKELVSYLQWTTWVAK